MQPLRGVVRAQAHIHPMAVAAVMGAHVAPQQGLAVRIGKIDKKQSKEHFVRNEFANAVGQNRPQK